MLASYHMLLKEKLLGREGKRLAASASTRMRRAAGCTFLVLRDIGVSLLEISEWKWQVRAWHGSMRAHTG